MKALLGRLERTYPARLVQAYGKSQAGNYAGTIALSMFMSMFPLMLGVLAILGLVIRDHRVEAQAVAAIVSLFPSDAEGALRKTLIGAKEHSGLLGIVGILGMLWGGTSIFATMEWVLDRLFGARQRSFVRQRLMGVVMTVLFVLAILLAVVANSALSVARHVPLLGPVVGLAIWVAFMVAIYRIVPNRTFKLTEVWRGALLAGILMEALSLAWPLYAHVTHGFTTYGATFALFFLLATWLVFLSQFILLGAVANRLSLGPPIQEGLVSEPEGGPVQTRETEAVESESERPSRGRRPAF